MIELNFLYIIIFCLTIVQSIVGIGVLVLGTPIMLLMNYNLVECFNLLLPFSIVTSGLNILVISLKNNFYRYQLNETKKSFFGKKILIYFFLVCIPALFCGLVLLKIFQNIINFKIVVGFFIIFSLIFKNIYSDEILNISNFSKKIIFFIIGLIHGSTNSCGALLSLFISTLNKNFKIESRFSITFFYFFLAVFQYSIFVLIFDYTLSLSVLVIVFMVCAFGSILGNYIINFINEYYLKKSIETLALITATLLILDGFNILSII